MPDVGDEHVKNIDDSVLCSCCDKEMTDTTHTCTLDTPADMDADTEKDNCHMSEIKMSKLNILFDLKSKPYYSYCSLAKMCNRIHCNKEYSLCKNCMSYVCSICFDRSFRWNHFKKCCKKYNISNVKYDEELNPK